MRAAFADCNPHRSCTTQPVATRQSRVARKIASSYLTNQVIRVSVSLAVSLTIYLSSFTRQSK